MHRHLVTALLAATWVASPCPVSAEVFRVTLLGTGAPEPTPERAQTTTLVEAGKHKLLFDGGRGVVEHLYALGVPLRDVSPVFLTHFHSDHVVGIPDLWLTGALPGPWAKRTEPFHVIGPVGTRLLMSGLAQAYAADIRIRTADHNIMTGGAQFVAEEFDHDGVVYEKDGVKVTAFEVDHGAVIKPAYGYRVDYAGHSVVLSGDTRFTEKVIKYGTAVDLLLHEVAAVRPEIADNPDVKVVLAHHTSPREAGTIFSRSHPRLAAYTHVVLLARQPVPALTTAQLVAQTRETYPGPLEVGADFMSFDIADGKVTVHRRGDGAQN
jgi:ribonuclease Z